MKLLKYTTYLLGILLTMSLHAGNIAYIHGDIASDGTTPSGSEEPYDQMLLTDTGKKGLSQFKAMVEAEGHQIQPYYDQDTLLDAAFLNQFDAIIFSLHQKIWSNAEKASLDTWLQAGGGMLIYSDSASGGYWATVGARNTVGQSVTNNLISQYGMAVTVDQADGVKAIRAGSDSTHPIVSDRIVLEGEGVSPVAVDPNSGAIRLIPYENDPEYVVSGTPTTKHTQNITIQNPEYAALALAPVGEGNIIAMFDRQPMWNDGPGSDINERDNKEILRRIVNYITTPSINSGFETWQEGQFSAEELADPAISSPLGDPDGSGLVNLLRYAFGLDRGDPHQQALPQVTWDEQGNLLFTYQRLVDPGNTEYIIEISDDLTATTPEEGGWRSAEISNDLIEESTLTADDGITDLKRYGVPLDPAKPTIFLRLKVE